MLWLFLISTVIILWICWKLYRKYSCDVCGVITDNLDRHKDCKVCSKKCFKHWFDKQT